jgi:hypothetical protein
VFIFRLWRNGHEPFGSHPNHENYPLYEGTPPHGNSEEQRESEVFEKSPIRRGGAPSGAAAFIVPEGLRGSNSGKSLLHPFYEVKNPPQNAPYRIPIFI